MRISDWSSDVCSSDLISPEDGWHIASIRPMALSDLKPEQEEFFELALETYTRSSWRTPKAKPAAKYSLAILHNPADALPPSDKRTLQKLIRIGEQKGVEVEKIGRTPWRERGWKEGESSGGGVTVDKK